MAIGTLFTLFILPVVYLVIAAEHRPREHDADAEETAPLAVRESLA
jgi:hypothetical protein